MEKYYFKTAGFSFDTCVEPCQIKKGTMIGSVSCQKCENLTDKDKPCNYTGQIDWIKCKEIEKAKPKT